MITEITLAILFLFHFQIDKISEYFFQYRFLSSSLIIENIKVLQYDNLIRIVTFNLFHNSLNHLLINSIGFITYGIALENYFNNYSKLLFPKIILSLMVLSGIIYTAFNYILTLLTEDLNHYFQKACGFSTVIFGLKFLYYYLAYGDENLALKRIFAHFIYVHVLIPNASLVGHLSGFLGGYIIYKVLDLQ